MTQFISEQDQIFEIFADNVESCLLTRIGRSGSIKRVRMKPQSSFEISSASKTEYVFLIVGKLRIDHRICRKGTFIQLQSEEIHKTCVALTDAEILLVTK